jgi:hypothetical protein
MQLGRVSCDAMQRMGPGLGILFLMAAKPDLPGSLCPLTAGRGAGLLAVAGASDFLVLAKY